VSEPDHPGPAEGAPDEAARRRGLRKASLRLLPLIGLGYGVAYMDRQNISFASLQMNQDLHFSATVYGLGAGLFFVSYALLEVPSNVMLLKFGARRWLARIMLTWGVLAMATMLVRTPVQFYVVRLLLGAAEAGFFPGVVFYLMQWFPAHERGRAINGFYVALPLSAAVMGVVAGGLLGLRGLFGLAGWQWLFLAEGLPAVVLSVVLLVILPDNPAQARWLEPGERAAIEHAVALDRNSPMAAADHGVLRALANPMVWLLGVAFLCIQCAGYALNFSAPTILQGATRWSATAIGLLVAAVALLGAGGMILAGWHSDRRRERHLHLVAFLLAMAGAQVALGISTSAWTVVPAYVVAPIFFYAIQSVVWLIPSDVLRGRAAAGGIAAMGSIGMFGGFIGPSAFGVAKDYTGSYQAGLLWLAVPYLVAAGIVLVLRRNARRAARATTAAAFAAPAA
jgi:ACS family tartrate transporter-like MFS transporter